jgi:hypothetical protein
MSIQQIYYSQIRLLVQDGNVLIVRMNGKWICVILVIVLVILKMVHAQFLWKRHFANHHFILSDTHREDHQYERLDQPEQLDYDNAPEEFTNEYAYLGIGVNTST